MQNNEVRKQEVVWDKKQDFIDPITANIQRMGLQLGKNRLFSIKT